MTLTCVNEIIIIIQIALCRILFVRFVSFFTRAQFIIGVWAVKLARK
jgi:hypothetical protein